MLINRRLKSLFFLHFALTLALFCTQHACYESIIKFVLGGSERSRMTLWVINGLLFPQSSAGKLMEEKAFPIWCTTPKGVLKRGFMSGPESHGTVGGVPSWIMWFPIMKDTTKLCKWPDFCSKGHVSHTTPSLGKCCASGYLHSCFYPFRDPSGALLRRKHVSLGPALGGAFTSAAAKGVTHFQEGESSAVFPFFAMEKQVTFQ